MFLSNKYNRLSLEKLLVENYLFLSTDIVLIRQTFIQQHRLFINKTDIYLN